MPSRPESAPWVKRESGLRLGEHERFDHKMEKGDLFEQTPDGVITVADLWVEDTLGHRYAIRDAKKNLALLLESNMLTTLFKPTP